MTAEEVRQFFGTRLREFRKEKGLSQQALADRCYGEITKSNISRLETHLEQRPTRAVVEVLSRALDWPIDEARQLAGYAPEVVDWPAVTASELIYALEKYPQLSEESRRFVREQIGDLIGFLLEMEEGPGLEGQMRAAPAREIPSIRLEDISKERGPGKNK